MIDRNRGRRGSGKKPGGRRPPPAEETGAEGRYLEKVKTSGLPVVIELRDGERLEGTVEYYDRDMIKITRLDGPNCFVRKNEIRCIHEGSPTDH